MATIKRYVSMARVYDPVIPKELGDRVVDQYVELRQQVRRERRRSRRKER